MHQEKKRDIAFEISFFESVLKRDRSYPEVIEILGGLYTKEGRIEDGLKMDRKLVRLQPDNPTARYNLACSHALLGKPELALRTLRKAIDLGYNDLAWMIKDPDFASLREHPGFVALLSQIKA